MVPTVPSTTCRGLMFEVGAAIVQVGRAGSERQVEAVGDILADTRRRIYLVLADGDTGSGEGDGTTGGDEGSGSSGGSGGSGSSGSSGSSD